MQSVSAKSILIPNKYPSGWFGIKYTMNLYRGCDIQCIYCDSRSERYGIDDFHNVTVKTNALELLRKELATKRSRESTIGTGSMSDPYTLMERKLQMTRRALEIIAEFRFPVHITTKSDLILRDLDILQHLSRKYASVAVSITTADDELARKLEPHAPSSTERFKTLAELEKIGVVTSMTMMPILPFLEDQSENIDRLVEKAAAAGVKHIIAVFGVTLRDRQRDYFFRKLDEGFPGLSERYKRKFGNAYECRSEREDELMIRFHEVCSRNGISTRMPSYQMPVSNAVQMSLFDE
ncbi:SPL family radical SAM protein [Paenibacillus sp. Soil522]|uniref:SPL family radical SAM protein n=1 Tax=Paenibacillus sp. Soil522 TaxID=1736388 RepID=UPI0006FBDA52|nr:radical SAM protein [Paenibacillus sp. Soil522]KRE33952.1 radical SAM protein [Paenibacillus sp. Soil522]